MKKVFAGVLVLTVTVSMGVAAVSAADLSGDRGVYTVKSSAKKQSSKKKAVPAKGKTVTVKNLKYKITKSAAKNGTAAVSGVKNKKVKSLTVPATIKVSGYTFKVTSIAPKAFSGCGKQCRITVNSPYIRNNWNRNYTDADGDGVCDNYGWYCGNGNYTDADGNGVCDYYGQHCGHGSGHGMCRGRR